MHSSLQAGIINDLLDLELLKGEKAPPVQLRFNELDPVIQRVMRIFNTSIQNKVRASHQPAQLSAFCCLVYSQCTACVLHSVK
jgi:hypothetical protein